MSKSETGWVPRVTVRHVVVFSAMSVDLTEMAVTVTVA